jgi:hypothetical protein
MSTKLIRLEADDPELGGFAIEFPSGVCKSAVWRSQAPFTDTLTSAKEYATRMLQDCLTERRIDDAERTNWASVTAAIQRIVTDWSDIRRRQLYAAVDNPPPPTPEPQPTNG